MRSKWITHRGRRILYSDYTRYSVEDFSALQEELAAVETEICSQPEDSVLLITDVTGSVASREAVELFKESAARSKKHVFKNAVIGITGLKKILFDAVVRFSGQNARAFDDLQKGKDWLAGQD